VIECLKHRYNNGLRSNLNFYRDSAGNEVDLLLEQAAEFYALEIKGGATVNPDYFKGLRKLESAFPGQTLGGGVVYAGEKEQKRSDWGVIPFTQLTTPQVLPFREQLGFSS
jgi:hypothetical protein